MEIVETGAGATTNAAGEYAIASVPNGSYSMRFSKTGFNTAYEIGINVSTEQDTAVPPVQLTVLRGHLAGTVLLEDGSSPTVVQVSVLGTDRVSAVQEDGSWEINEVVPGNYVVELRATGEYAGQYRRHEQPVTVVGGQTATFPTLTLPRAKGTLTGQVTLEDETLFSGVLVEILGSGMSTMTNALGEFSVTGVPRATTPSASPK